MKNKILRYKLIELHTTYAKHGQYEEARVILCLLRYGRVPLGIGDVDWKVERALEELGCVISYSGRGYCATAYAYAV